MRKPRGGYRWRILCHSRGENGGPWSRGNHHTEHQHDDAIPDETEFDELVVGHWLHIEEMDHHVWWMDVGGVVLWVTVRRNGEPKSVTVFAPGDYNMPVDGCEYFGAVADEAPARVSANPPGRSPGGPNQEGT